MTRLLSVAISLLIWSAVALGADVDGRWTGHVGTPNGDFPTSFTFKADGTTLTGSMTGADGSRTTIENGKVEGSRISFSVALKGTAVILDCSGSMSGDQIKLSADVEGDAFKFVLKKSN